MTKRINGYTVHIEKNKVHLEETLGRYNTGSHKIYLNLNAINKIDYEINDIEIKISLILIHEYIHKLLFLTEDENTCGAWDNISGSFISYGSG